jgi:hypothetical protein
MLKQDVKTSTISVRKLVNGRVAETSIKMVRYELCLVSYFSVYGHETLPMGIKVSRKAMRSRVGRRLSLEEIRKLVSFTRNIALLGCRAFETGGCRLERG